MCHCHDNLVLLLVGRKRKPCIGRNRIDDRNEARAKLGFALQGPKFLPN